MSDDQKFLREVREEIKWGLTAKKINGVDPQFSSATKVARLLKMLEEERAASLLANISLTRTTDDDGDWKLCSRQARRELYGEEP